MFKFRLEGEQDVSQEVDTNNVQENAEFIDNEQADVVNNQVEDQVDDQEESAEVIENNVLTFNSDDDVLEYLKSKEELLSKVSKNEVSEIPDDIKPYLDYKKETGRSYNDYLELQKDFSSLPEEVVIKNYIKEMNPEYTDEEVEDEFLDTYGYDEDSDEEREINKKIRSFKKSHSEALKYFDSLKEKYKAPLAVSNESIIPEDYAETKQLIENIRGQEEISKKQSEYFLQKTDELFSNEFKGFEFKIGDEVISQKVSNINSVKKDQSNIMNFFGKFLDENGLIKDPEGYHKALYVAMNYDSVLQNVYETAKAKAIEEEIKNSKNIDMGGIRKAQENIQSGIKFKLV
jgi:hypothetical protein